MTHMPIFQSRNCSPENLPSLLNTFMLKTVFLAMLVVVMDGGLRGAGSPGSIETIVLDCVCVRARDWAGWLGGWVGGWVAGWLGGWVGGWVGGLGGGGGGLVPDLWMTYAPKGALVAS